MPDNVNCFPSWPCVTQSVSKGSEKVFERDKLLAPRLIGEALKDLQCNVGSPRLLSFLNPKVQMPCHCMLSGHFV